MDTLVEKYGAPRYKTLDELLADQVGEAPVRVDSTFLACAFTALLLTTLSISTPTPSRRVSYGLMGFCVLHPTPCMARWDTLSSMPGYICSWKNL